MKNPDLPLHLQVIISAYSLLRERGRCKGEFANKKGQFCIIGALNMAHTILTGARAHQGFLSESLTPPAVRCAGQALERHIPSGILSLWFWQDQRGTSDKDVWDLFERTIAAEMSKIAEKTTA